MPLPKESMHNFPGFIHDTAFNLMCIWIPILGLEWKETKGKKVHMKSSVSDFAVSVAPCCRVVFWNENYSFRCALQYHMQTTAVSTINRLIKLLTLRIVFILFVFFQGSTRWSTADLEFCLMTGNTDSWLSYLHLPQICRRGREGTDTVISPLDNLQYQRYKICRLSIFKIWTLNIHCNSANTLQYFEISIWRKKNHPNAS